MREILGTLKSLSLILKNEVFMDAITQYSSTLKHLKKECRKVALKLRSTRKTKVACEDAGYLMYYPHLLSDLIDLSDTKRIIRKDIRVYSQLLKEELKDEHIKAI
jgi:hypothetical protein